MFAASARTATHDSSRTRPALTAFEDEKPEVRIAALDVLLFAVRRSDELFDWLSVLLDDEHEVFARRPVVPCSSHQPSRPAFGPPLKMSSLVIKRTKQSRLERFRGVDQNMAGCRGRPR